MGVLCDDCGICCLYKLETKDERGFFTTDVGLPPAILKRCRCTAYSRAARRMPTVSCSPRLVRPSDWLPSTCAYRRVKEGQDLELVAPAGCLANLAWFTSLGISSGKSIPEQAADLENLEERVVGLVYLAGVRVNAPRDP